MGKEEYVAFVCLFGFWSVRKVLRASRRGLSYASVGALFVITTIKYCLVLRL